MFGSKPKGKGHSKAAKKENLRRMEHSYEDLKENVKDTSWLSEERKKAKQKVKNKKNEIKDYKKRK